MSQKRKIWSPKRSAELYYVNGWGEPYFTVGKDGHVLVHPQGRPGRHVSLKTLVDQIVERGISAPSRAPACVRRELARAKRLLADRGPLR